MSEAVRGSPGSEAVAWHAVPADQVIGRLKTDPAAGLDASEASRRLSQYGPNRLPEGKQRGPLMRFFAQLNNVLVYVLLGAGFVKLMVGLWLDAAVILGVVIINALLGFFQEGKAEKALDSIRNMLSAEARTIRGRETRLIPAEELVPGDVVLLESGDRIPADLRLVDVKNLRTEEAALTGESVPIDKTTDAVAAKATVGDREGMAFSGTLVSSGRGTGVVVGTGSDTELGPHQPADGWGQRARYPAAAPDQEVRIRDHRRDRRGRGDRVRLWQMGPGHGLRLHLSGGRQHRRFRHPGRSAGADHRHLGDRRAADGPAQRHHPAAAGGRNPGLGLADLLRQDRHPDPDGDDGGIGRHRRCGLQGHRPGLRAGRRGAEGRGARQERTRFSG